MLQSGLREVQQCLKIKAITICIALTSYWAKVLVKIHNHTFWNFLYCFPLISPMPAT